MKKIITLTTILIQVLILNACSLLYYDYNFEIPEFDTYKIETLTFEDYVPSNVNDITDIEIFLNEQAVLANIKLITTSYDTEVIFSRKDVYTGSGVIFYENEDYYYALSNYHVVDKVDGYINRHIEVRDYYNNSYHAFIYPDSLDYNLDLVVIVFEKTDTQLQVLELVDGQIEVGRDVIVISNPLSSVNVITYGTVKMYSLVKVTNRDGEEKSNLFMSIGHDALINNGSSGSMLINYDFKIVGINYAGQDDDEADSLSFAVPSILVVDYLNNLIRNQQPS